MRYDTGSKQYEYTRIDGSVYKVEDPFPTITSTYWGSISQWNPEDKITWDEISPSLQELILRKIKFSDLHITLQNRILWIESELVRLEAKIDDVDRRLHIEINNRIKQDEILQDQLDDHEDRIRELELRMANAEEEIENLWTDVRALWKEIWFLWGGERSDWVNNKKQIWDIPHIWFALRRLWGSPNDPLDNNTDQEIGTFTAQGGTTSIHDIRHIWFALRRIWGDQDLSNSTTDTQIGTNTTTNKYSIQKIMYALRRLWGHTTSPPSSDRTTLSSFVVGYDGKSVANDNDAAILTNTNIGDHTCDYDIHHIWWYLRYIWLLIGADKGDVKDALRRIWGWNDMSNNSKHSPDGSSYVNPNDTDKKIFTQTGNKGGSTIYDIQHIWYGLRRVWGYTSTSILPTETDKEKLKDAINSLMPPIDGKSVGNDNDVQIGTHTTESGHTCDYDIHHIWAVIKSIWNYIQIESPDPEPGPEPEPPGPEEEQPITADIFLSIHYNYDSSTGDGGSTLDDNYYMIYNLSLNNPETDEKGIKSSSVLNVNLTWIVILKYIYDENTVFIKDDLNTLTNITFYLPLAVTPYGSSMNSITGTIQNEMSQGDSNTNRNISMSYGNTLLIPNNENVFNNGAAGRFKRGTIFVMDNGYGVGFNNTGWLDDTPTKGIRGVEGICSQSIYSNLAGKAITVAGNGNSHVFGSAQQGSSIAISGTLTYTMTTQTKVILSTAYFQEGESDAVKTHNISALNTHFIGPNSKILDPYINNSDSGVFMNIISATVTKNG